MQVSEKKLKNVSNLNLDPTQRVGNGSSMGSSPVLSPKGFSPRSMNGGAVRRPLTTVSPDFVFPPGGIPSLRLPTVFQLFLSLSPPSGYHEIIESVLFWISMHFQYIPVTLAEVYSSVGKSVSWIVCVVWLCWHYFFCHRIARRVSILDSSSGHRSCHR